MSKNVQRELTADTYLVRYKVGPNQTGTRLDHFLKDHYRHRSRETLKKAIDTGAITVSRTQSPHLTVGKLKPSSQLVSGDEVHVLSEKKPEPEVNFDYRVIFEDDVLFVIDKPANLPVHPSGRYFFNTLLIHLKTKGHTHPTLNAEELYFLAHRIDKETSGILVLTKDSESCAKITAQFAERKTEKAYLAVVRGITPEKFEIHEAMNRSKTSKIGLKMECMPENEGGLTAATRFERLEVHGQFSLVRCFPKTGRQHQIRVHLERAGHPIVGDKLYGVDEEFALLFYERERLTPEAEARLLIPRHALHSTGLKFDHPTTGQRLSFESPLPTDLREFLDRQK
jgi:23S rRNA pseudouridine1911/1915/1917 synthase